MEAYRNQVVRGIRKRLTEDDLQIPPYPAVAMQLRQLARRHDFGIADAVRLVRTDPAISAQALRYANSSGTGRGDVTSLDRAIGLMGIEELLVLATVGGLGGAASVRGSLVEIRRAIWSRTMLRAQVAEMLAKHRSLKTDVAFMCGLLCDFGKVVTARCIEQYLAGEPKASAMPARFWFDIIQIYEAEIGLLIAERWNLPEPLFDVMRELAARQFGNPLAELVLAADQVVGILKSHPCVTMEDLLGANRLREAERADVLASVPRLFDLAARLMPESAPSRGRAPESKVVTAVDPGFECFPASLRVEVIRSGGKIPFASVSAGYAGIVIVGKTPLPEHELMRVVVKTPSSQLEVFASVVAASKERGLQQLVMRFFAMSKEQKAAWDACVSSVRRAEVQVSA
jgi:HD-like signal output (HDOD) protein